MKFKDYIHHEINLKEVEPSHDAWDRIQVRMKNQPEILEAKSSKKWWAVAATVIGLGICTTVFFINQKPAELQIISYQNSGDIKQDSNQSNSIDNKEENMIITSESDRFADANSTIKVEKINKEDNLPEKSEYNTPIAVEKVEEQKVNVEKIVLPPLANGFKQTQIVTNLDTVKVHKKKNSNYVDPNMLLYSIENKESLKESNSHKSKVAVIDLNK